MFSQDERAQQSLGIAHGAHKRELTAAEKLRGSIMAVVVGLVECLQLIGVSFSANDAVWPPGLDAARSLFGAWLGGGISSYTAPDWAGSFWSALVVGGMFLGAMIAQISTNLLVREEFSWKFGGTTGGVGILVRWSIGLRRVDTMDTPMPPGARFGPPGRVA